MLIVGDMINNASDQELLRRFSQEGADEAFAELVKRHCNLVWAAARRVCGDDELARDVAQSVFTDLARKASRLSSGTSLVGWLHLAACHTATKQIRGETRRTKREQQAMQQTELQVAEAAEARAAAELQPALDAALAQLPETDRNAVVLRFLAGRSFAEIGATLGTNEDAAQKRVSRALDKLRENFRQRGVDLAAGTVVAAMTLAGTQAAPAGLATGIASASLGTAASVSWVASLTGMKTQIGVAAIVLATATVAVWNWPTGQIGPVHSVVVESSSAAAESGVPAIPPPARPVRPRPTVIGRSGADSEGLAEPVSVLIPRHHSPNYLWRLLRENRCNFGQRHHHSNGLCWPVASPRQLRELSWDGWCCMGGRHPKDPLDQLWTIPTPAASTRRPR